MKGVWHKAFYTLFAVGVSLILAALAGFAASEWTPNITKEWVAAIILAAAISCAFGMIGIFLINLWTDGF